MADDAQIFNIYYIIFGTVKARDFKFDVCTDDDEQFCEHAKY